MTAEDELGELKAEEASEVELAATRSEPAKSIWARYAGWILFGVGFVVYMVIVPTVGLIIERMNPVAIRELTDMTTGEWIRLHTVSGVVMLIFLGLGLCIGSFLNVVIYRLPRSMPVLWPPSSCSNCHTRLRGKDNIPVLAWLKLGGRCRYCSAPISARYPIIEALVGIIVVLFYYWSLLSGGENLPVREPNFYRGIVWILLYTKWDLVTIYLFHILLIVLLLAWSMINYDRFRVPVIAAASCCLSVLGLACAFPHLNPTNKSWQATLDPVPASIVISSAGCLMGVILGWMLNRVASLRKDPPAKVHDSDDQLDQTPAAETQIRTTEAQAPATTADEHLEPHEPPGQYDLRQSPEQPYVPLAPERTETAAVTDAYGQPSANPTVTDSAVASLALVGAALGVEAVVVVFGVTLLLTLATWLLRANVGMPALSGRKLPTTMFVFIATVLLLLFWDAVHHQITVRLYPVQTAAVDWSSKTI